MVEAGLLGAAEDSTAPVEVALTMGVSRVEAADCAGVEDCTGASGLAEAAAEDVTGAGVLPKILPLQVHHSGITVTVMTAVGAAGHSDLDEARGAMFGKAPTRETRARPKAAILNANILGCGVRNVAVL